MARFGSLLFLGVCLLLSACEPAAVALLGGGASTVLRYNLDGIASRTFTAPSDVVKTASLAALDRMGITVDGCDPLDVGEVIRARAPNRDIEVELEPITKHATRIRITARGGSLFYDNATAVELVAQTEKMLDAGVTAKLAAPTAAATGGSRPTNQSF